MRKLLILGATFVVSMAIVMTACKKDEVNNNGNNSNNTENPGGGSGSDGGSETGNYNHQEYPYTANVIRKAVTDVDGNIYDAVQIGNQVWMAENLRTTKYADGTSIPLGTSTSTTTSFRYAPGPNQSNEENITNVPRYGYLYNGPAVMHGASSSNSNPSGVQGICPNGWHVPSWAEWKEMTNYVSGQSQYVCGGNNSCIAKALASTTGWSNYSGTCAVGNDPSSNNATGFSALPAGGYNGAYGGLGLSVSFWSVSNEGGGTMSICGLIYYNNYVDFTNSYKYYGRSVRCVRD